MSEPDPIMHDARPDGTEPIPWYSNVDPESGNFNEGWQSGLPEYLRDEPSLQDFNSPEDIARAFVATKQNQGRFSRAKGLVPDLAAEEIPKEELESFRKGMGIPDDPAGYNLSEMEMPEGFEMTPELAEELAPMLHKNHIRPEAMPDLMQAGAQMVARAMEARDAAEVERVKGETAELQKLWGANFDDEVEKACKLAELHGETLEPGHFLDREPGILRLLNKVARHSYSEDTLNNVQLKPTTENNMQKAFELQHSPEYRGERGFDAQAKAAAEIRRLRQEHYDSQ